MSLTINFCGDSYCAWIDDRTKPSWCVHLANKLNAKIIGGGKEATAYEYAIKSFNSSADINIFCWTHVNRLYHKDYHCSLTNGVLPLRGGNNNELLTLLGESFYRNFFDLNYFRTLQMRSLYWFDQEVLSKYSGLSLHIFNFEKTYTFSNGLNYDRILRDLYASSKTELTPCHMSDENNELVAEEVYSLLKNHL